MRILIPARRFEDAKSRLRPIWDRKTRAECAQWMLSRVIGAFQEAGMGNHITVMSADPHVLRCAASLGVCGVGDAPHIQGHGNQVRDFARALPPQESLLVAMSDLPLLRAADAQTLLNNCAHADVLLAPDRHQLGTNAAYFRNHRCRTLHFGYRDSFQRHLATFKAHNSVHIHRVPGFEYDLDSPEDLAAICRWQREHAPYDGEFARLFCGSHA